MSTARWAHVARKGLYFSTKIINKLLILITLGTARRAPAVGGYRPLISSNNGPNEQINDDDDDDDYKLTR